LGLVPVRADQTHLLQPAFPTSDSTSEISKKTCPWSSLPTAVVDRGFVAALNGKLSDIRPPCLMLLAIGFFLLGSSSPLRGAQHGHIDRLAALYR